jgi:hypothetical protein
METRRSPRLVGFRLDFPWSTWAALSDGFPNGKPPNRVGPYRKKRERGMATRTAGGRVALIVRIMRLQGVRTDALARASNSPPADGIRGSRMPRIECPPPRNPLLVVSAHSPCHK